MKNYTITVNGNVYDVVVEEGASTGAPAAAPAALPDNAPDNPSLPGPGIRPDPPAPRPRSYAGADRHRPYPSALRLRQAARRPPPPAAPRYNSPAPSPYSSPAPKSSQIRSLSSPYSRRYHNPLCLFSVSVIIFFISCISTVTHFHAGRASVLPVPCFYGLWICVWVYRCSSQYS